MDYQLYPIRKSDIDLPVYLMVKAMMVMSSVKNYQHYEQEFPEEAHLPMRELAMKYEQYAIYLIFPSHHPQFRLFPSEVSSQRVIIAVYRQPNPNGLAFEDAYRFVGFLDSDLKFHECKYGKVPIPAFPDASGLLVSAINSLLNSMETRQITGNDWYQRLTNVRTMVTNHVEGLHILHNAGLFDHASLWKQLAASGIWLQEVDTLKARLTEALAMFAMSVVNATWQTTKVAPPAGEFRIPIIGWREQKLE